MNIVQSIIICYGSLMATLYYSMGFLSNKRVRDEGVLFSKPAFNVHDNILRINPAHSAELYLAMLIKAVRQQ